VLQLTSALKDLPIRLQSASRKERKATFAALKDVINNPGAPKLQRTEVERKFAN